MVNLPGSLARLLKESPTIFLSSLISALFRYELSRYDFLLAALSDIWDLKIVGACSSMDIETINFQFEKIKSRDSVTQSREVIKCILFRT